MLKHTYFLIFALSGFSGLIYQSIWSHYLKLFLGHAAYAQMLVLVIFMGGMAIGAWLASLMGGRLRNLLLAYAIVEGIIGAFALGFHQLFIASTDYAYAEIIPHLTGVDDVNLFKWGLAAALILPQSILLGLTFPYMSAGLIRKFPNAPGRTLAILYFTNSLGAAIGVLVSGFVLIGLAGLPGTVMTAGFINILVALWVWWLCRSDKPLPSLTTTLQPTQTHRPNGWLFFAFLWFAALTGMASFIYEIAWIRMLSLVLGSSTHAFELMLSAFILGLALGSWWIKGHIDHLRYPLRALGLIQVAMGLLALATIFIYGESFEWMQFILNALTATNQGYFLFNLSSHAIALLIMLPATFCAGMTLPLLTHYLVTRGHGEKSIGNVYAANTFGSIVGVLLAVLWLMPAFGLKNLLLIGGGIDIVLGLLLLMGASRVEAEARTTYYWTLAATGMAGAVLVFGTLFYQLDPLKMASGIYRFGRLLDPTTTEVLFQQDGKTASITTLYHQDEGRIAIRTNGKTDAGIFTPEVSRHNLEHATNKMDDSPTMILAAALPWALHPESKTAAVIGMGSGITSQTFLHFPSIEQVDTIEIETAMVTGARLFGEHVDKVFTDPRSHIYIEDAKTYFVNHQSRYDIIVSEPSNPWVSGVAGLFSEEFYARVVQHLEPDGIFVQWLQLYEIEMELVASIVKALQPHFSDYTAYTPIEGDILILATPQGQLPTTFADVFTIPDLVEPLAFIRVNILNDLAIREVMPKPLIDKLVLAYPIAANSDYFPILDLRAVKSRYLKHHAYDIYTLRRFPAPLWEVLTGQDNSLLQSAVTATPILSITNDIHTARNIHAYLSALQAGQPPANADDLTAHDLELLQLFVGIKYHCEMNTLLKVWFPTLPKIILKTLPYLSAEEMQLIWQVVETAPCADELPPRITQWLHLYQAVKDFDPQRIIPLVNALLDITADNRAARSIQPSELNDYLMIVGLLAYLQMEDYESAVKLWQQYAEGTDTRFELRMSVAALQQRLNAKQ